MICHHRQDFDKYHQAIDEIRQRSCLVKQCYPDMLAAEFAITELMAKFGDRGGLLNGYYCVFCNNFHIGRKMKGSAEKLLSLDNLLGFDFSTSLRDSWTVHKSMAKLKTLQGIPEGPLPDGMICRHCQDFGIAYIATLPVFCACGAGDALREADPTLAYRRNHTDALVRELRA